MISKWLNSFVQSHLLLSISSFIFSIALLNRHELSVYFSIALSLSVFGLYNLNRLIKLKQNQLANVMRFWYVKNSVILYWLALISLSISVLIYFSLLKQAPMSLLLLGVMVLTTSLYIFTIKRINLRKIPGTKAIWISIVWAVVAVVLPKLTLNTFGWSDLHYFILFYALTIPGDSRDKELDNPRMNTIPQLIGNQKSQILFYLLLVLFLMFNYFLEDKKPIEIILVFLFSLILFAKRFSFKYEIMDGILLILGIASLIPF